MTSFKINADWAAHNMPNHQAALKAVQAAQDRLSKVLHARYPGLAAPVNHAAAPYSLQLGARGSNAEAGQVCSLDPHRGKRPVLGRQGLLEYLASNAPTPPGAASLSVSP